MARIGNNGGLIGVRRVPTTSNASGIWDADEQSLAKRAAIWPFTTVNPLEYSPTVWYRATSNVTLLDGLVSQWDDLSGNDNHMVQSTAGSRPSVVTNAVNGKNAVSFNGGKFLSSSESTITTPREIYVVSRYTQGNSFGYIPGLFSATNNSLGVWLTGINTGFYTNTYNGGHFVNGGATDRASNVFPEMASPCLIRAVANSTSTSSAGYQVGCDRDYYDSSIFGDRYWYGYICEILAFAQPLSVQDRNVIQEYLSTSWGITLV
jgi:hypothetical protein